jgi:hypothetical protein
MAATRLHLMATYEPVFTGGAAAWGDVKAAIQTPDVQPRDL